MPTQTRQNPACPTCACKLTVKKGVRRNRLQTLQVFRCTECLHRFTGAAGKNKTYPLHIILETVSIFNLGHSTMESQQILRRRFHANVPERTISSWLTAYRHLTTYARLRAEGKRLFAPDAIVHNITFHHQQVYRHQVHRAKLRMLLAGATPHAFDPLRTYLAELERTFPHQIFQSTEHRSSKFPADLRPPVTRKENCAMRMAALVLPTALNNKKRHETLQRFMLVNDSVTVAVEVPVFLSEKDILYYRSIGFNLDFQSAVITGHIDFLQIRNGYIHVLDYKPDARREKHAHVQLTIYALALARRTGLPVRVFKCGWFDEKNYFEFFPLQAVHPHPRNPVKAASLNLHGAFIKMRGEQKTNPTLIG